MIPIPFCDLGRALAPIRTDIDNAIAGCLDRSIFLHGIQTRAFEEEWAAFCGQKYAVCCNSGTDALTLAATALGMTSATIPANTLALTGIGLSRGGAKVSVAEITHEGWMLEQSDDAVPVLIYGRIPDPCSKMPRCTMLPMLMDGNLQLGRRLPGVFIRPSRSVRWEMQAL